MFGDSEGRCAAAGLVSCGAPSCVLPLLAGAVGSYNHNVMFDYLNGEGFFLLWKNGLTDEDSNGG